MHGGYVHIHIQYINKEGPTESKTDREREREREKERKKNVPNSYAMQCTCTYSVQGTA